MSVARTWAVALSGLDGALVEVEADLSAQTPEFRIIGLGDRALGEAVQRVHNACANSGLPLPRRRITVNLSPASLPKQGSSFDLAIAIAALATDGGLDLTAVESTVHLGELGLDGRIRPVAGVLPAVIAAARAGRRRIVVPVANLPEAALVDDIEVFGATSLAEVACRYGADVEVPDAEPVARPVAAPPAGPDAPDLADVIGQREAVDALVVAAAGGHHMLLSGPPGAGKTMLAQRLPGILPPLDERAALAVASIRSLSGETVTTLSRTPPLEAPHHTASVVALVGGGSRVIRPGAIARASEGVLFLDEAGEFPASVLDALRQPLERGDIEIHRSGTAVRYPARFQLVLATNPCPCGNYGVRGAVCECAPYAIRRYLSRLSGPLLDRVDIELPLRRVSTVAADPMASRVTSAEARERVADARSRAADRLRLTPWRRNVDVSGAWLRDGPTAPEPAIRRPLDVALERGALTLRGYDRVLRLAWTLADLDHRPRLEPRDIGKALYMKKGIAA
ncbi:YifB family Mg chelatase-like AAA ATPase [Microbacterium sp. cx-55]|uniref:YifB family Mg chelatase-like AAA ATPase n=1 Tax=unclassified Microbacterium TaxID=2609290 RepID=UPI001CBA8CFB|nr:MULTISPECIES: YifB family Mg chelatase-like AAA ATPase [unclassified Microbacterium]MBZ4486137.1 YifB family Mg chelatase-like AAA ATPase [Microbacterium sp. cx-55]MCC4907128.1 YifB family Mg chelatase-like AAA ATPase [Microbacterium sp. cx-59]UGB33992.1 YifB family Mg chelatase-like AAA ATPase [Microbacterium sp. cx-55]